MAFLDWVEGRAQSLSCEMQKLAMAKLDGWGVNIILGQSTDEFKARW